MTDRLAATEPDDYFVLRDRLVSYAREKAYSATWALVCDVIDGITQDDALPTLRALLALKNRDNDICCSYHHDQCGKEALLDAAEECGWTVHGYCDMAKAHNMGCADVPENHNITRRTA